MACKPVRVWGDALSLLWFNLSIRWAEFRYRRRFPAVFVELDKL